MRSAHNLSTPPLHLLLPLALLLAACADRELPTAVPHDPPSFSHAPEEPCVVNTTADAGAGSLRDAIDNHVCSTITFDASLNGQTIVLTSGQLTVERDVKIVGPGADLLAVARNSALSAAFRVFAIAGGAVVEISGLTISGGAALFGDFFGGGGVLNFGTLLLTHSTVSGNFAFAGGGIDNEGTLTLTRSTVSGNVTQQGGGGIYNNTTLTITNSTISGNDAGADPEGGGVRNFGTLLLTHSTLSGNTGRFATPGAIDNYGTATLENTIVVGICTGSGPLYDGGYNLETGTSCGFSAANHSLPSTEPLLGSLADNGGPTLTHALLAGSPAIDAGICTDHQGSAVTGDQRGVPRPQGPACDIGAFETEEDLLTVLIARSEVTPGIAVGTVNKLRDALVHAERGRTVPACSALAGYIEDLTNQAGKPRKVSVQDAAELIQAAEQIRSLLGC